MDAATTMDFVISRHLDAPRALVWQAWTDPAHLARWMGPKGCTTTHCALDLRPGGTYHYGLRTPDGLVMWGKWHIREVTAPEQLVFVQHFSDEDGGVTRHPLSATWPLYMLSTITLAEQGKGTLLGIRWAPHDATAAEIRTFNEAHAGMTQGWGGSLEQLAALLAQLQAGEGKPQKFTLRDTQVDVGGDTFSMVRVFAAPRARLWSAWTDPVQLARWWGPTGFTCHDCAIDLRPGGTWRATMRGADGTNYPLHADIHEVIAGERLVMTMNADDHPAEWHREVNAARGVPADERSFRQHTTVILEDVAGEKTRMTIRNRFATARDCAAVVKIGSAEGWTLSFTKLDAALAAH